MLKGEAIFENFRFIKNNPIPPGGTTSLPDSKAKECCYELPVLAESVFTSENNNDKSSKIWFYDESFSAVTLELEKSNGGSWTKVADLNDDSLGKFYALGFFVNNQQESAIGYQLDWALILAAHGIGKYRIKTVETNIFGNSNQYSFEWTLKIYSPELANKSTRISWWMNGITGDSRNDLKTRDFGAINWFNEIRLANSLFWSKSSEYEKEYVQYQNGQQVWIKDERRRSYKYELRQAPNYIHELISGEVLQADTIQITDYNSENPAVFEDCKPEMINVAVKLSSNYEPSWNFGSKYATVQLDFINEYQNFIRKRC